MSARCARAIAAAILFLSLAAPPLARPEQPRPRAIAGGEAVGVRDFPSVVALGIERVFGVYSTCTGSLISDDWVLTAAHCVDGVGASEVFALHGYPTYTDVKDIGRIELHPDYHPLTVGGRAADIALVKLLGPFESRAAQPVRLVTEAEALLHSQPGVMTTTVGWGGSNATTMHKAEWPLRECPEDAVQSLCTAATAEIAVEQGDSGSPLLAGLPSGERAQLGVLYWRGSVQRYVPVAPYLEWIAETTAEPDHLAVTLENNTPETCTVNFGNLLPVLLLAGETRAFKTPAGETLSLSASCSDGAGPPPAPPPFRPQGIDIALGTSGETVTLMTTEAGGYTLNGRAFASGSTVTASNGDVYQLVLDGTTWTAVRVDP